MAERWMSPDGQIWQINDAGDLAPVNDVNPAAAGRAAAQADFEDLNALEQTAVAFRSRTQGLTAGVTEARADLMDVGSDLWNGVLAAPFGIELSDGEELRQQAQQLRATIDPGVEATSTITGPNIIGGAPVDMAFSRFGMLPATAGEIGAAALEAPPGEGVNRAAGAAAGAVIGEGLGRTLGVAVDFSRGVINNARELYRQGVEATVEAVPELGIDPLELLRGRPQDVVSRQAAIADQLQKIQVTGEELAQRGSTEWRRLRDRADYLGFATTPGQRSGNLSRQQIEASLSRNPITSLPYAEKVQFNERRLAEILNEAMGVAGDTLDEETLAVAGARIADSFDEVAEALGDDVFAGRPSYKAELSDLAWRGANIERRDITRAAQDKIKGPASQAATNMSQILQGTGAVSGRDLMNWRSNLVRVMQTPTTDPTSKLALGEMVDAIDGVIEQVAGGEARQAYRDTRLRWRLWKTITGASQAAVDQAGKPSARRLAATLRAEYPDDFRLGGLRGFDPGRSQAEQSIAYAFDALRVGSTILHDVVPNSGTPTGMFVNQILQDVDNLPTMGARILGGQQLSRLTLALPSADVARSVSPLIGRGARSVGSAAGERD